MKSIIRPFSIFPVLVFALASPASAQISTSASYELLTAEPGPGGGAVQSSGGTITAEISVSDGIAGGVSNVTGGGVQTKGNFTGQLYDPVSLDVTGTPSSVNETAATQLSASAVMDDATTLALDPNDIAWSVMAGPFSGVTAGGLATSTNIYQNEIGQLRGIWQTLQDIENISVLNVGDDDFGSYAGDGLDDAWQVNFFGLDNPDAGPGEDPDGDQQDNQLENLAGVDPTDASSSFDVRIELVTGQPTHRRVVFTPFFIDRTYRMLWSPDLATAFAILGGTTSENTGDGGTGKITDINAVEVRKFYQIEISRP